MEILAAKKDKSAGDENPYLSSKKEWNEYAKEITTSRFWWQLTAIISLLIAFGAIGGIVYIGQQSKFVPYVVEVDKLGEYRAAGMATITGAVDSRIIRTSVLQFVHDTRVVSPDITLQRKAITDVYYKLQQNSPAIAKMNEMYGSPITNPLERAQTVMVEIKIQSVLPLSEKSWQVDWTETVRDRQGAIQDTPIPMRGLMTMTVSPSTGGTQAQVQNNPLGIYVHDFSWSRQL